MSRRLVITVAATTDNPFIVPRNLFRRDDICRVIREFPRYDTWNIFRSRAICPSYHREIPCVRGWLIYTINQRDVRKDACRFEPGLPGTYSLRAPNISYHLRGGRDGARPMQSFACAPLLVMQQLGAESSYRDESERVISWARG